MSDEGDTFWVSLAEKFFGLILVIIGAIMIYFTATTSGLGAFTAFFGVCKRNYAYNRSVSAFG